MSKKVRVGIIGCGKISNAYFEGCRKFKILDVVACADLNRAAAESKGHEFEISKVYTVDEILADKEIDIIINLTIPAAHAKVSLAALNARKHVYSEKPLGLTREEGKKILAAAKKKKVRVGCAPDTFMGGGIQTCRQLIDQGAIGEVIAANAFMLSPGVESWHPNPIFYYKPGGGPMFDMGPYYLTALINLVGPMTHVSSVAEKLYDERLITSEPLRGQKIKVEVSTHYSGTVRFAQGAIGTLIMSFDVWGRRKLPHIQIHGTKGSLTVPDPNNFSGTVEIIKAGEKEWTEIPLTHTAPVKRGVGVADLAASLLKKRDHRANGEVAYHVLDVMCAFDEGAKKKKEVKVQSTCKKPIALKPESYSKELAFVAPLEVKS